MNQDNKRFIPTLDAVYEALAEAIEGWADGLGIQTEYFDPIHEEGGRQEWTESLRSSCNWALRTALSLLAARGGASQAEDLNRRMEALYEAADGYEQRLDALEDQRGVHIEGLVAQYRKAFGDEDPDGARLGQLCQGKERIWTFKLEDSLPETPAEFAEAIDRARFTEDGAKRRAQAEMKGLTAALGEHFRLLAGIEAEHAEPGGDPKTESAASAEDEDSEGAADEEMDIGLPEVDPYDDRVVNSASTGWTVSM